VRTAAYEFETIRVEPDGAITWIVLNRPEKRNAINGTMLDEFASAMTSLGADTNVRVVGVRGEGPCFSSGYDIGSEYTEAMESRDAFDEWDDLRGRLDRMMLIWDAPVPVIAAVHGHCLAGATQLCTFCDLVAVTDDATIGSPGLSSGAGYVSPMYVLTLGIRRAKELGMVPGRQITGRRAAEWGWANWSTLPDCLLSSVREVAEIIAMKPRDIVAANKVAMNRMAELAGFRYSISQLADIDVIAHRSRSAAAARRSLNNDGPGEVARRFAQEVNARLEGGLSET
jgi:enoyl-CoA hydratase